VSTAAGHVAACRRELPAQPPADRLPIVLLNTPIKGGYAALNIDNLAAPTRWCGTWSNVGIGASP
jgi:hypothetical protein